MQSDSQVKTQQESLQVSEQACKQLSKKVSSCTTAAKPASSIPQECKQCIAKTARMVVNA